MKLIIRLFSFCLFLTACSTADPKEKSSDMSDRNHISVFQGSQYIDDKTYEVVLPASYAQNEERRYPVLYMMDRQNLFVDSMAYGGAAWNIDQVADSLAEAGRIEEVIIVGIDHAGYDRFAEYMPQKPAEALPKDMQDSLMSFLKKPLYADRYLEFLVKELKPLIDQQYRTKAGTEDTFIGGSSMGGLISMYAQCEYPEVFGGALCLSTHWPIFLEDPVPTVPAEIIGYFSQNLPKAKRWYFDYGTKGIDQYYEPYQQQVDSILIAQGYVEGENFISRKFDGHDHNERDWNRRVYIPLEFVFGKK